MSCPEFETDFQRVLHGANCIWRKEHPFDLTIGCFDPCAGIGNANACDHVAYGYCTWHDGTCRHRDQLRCTEFDDEFQCVSHNIHCGWTDGRCTLLMTPPDNPAMCKKFNFPTKCIRAPRRACAWEYGQGREQSLF